MPWLLLYLSTSVTSKSLHSWMASLEPAKPPPTINSLGAMLHSCYVGHTAASVVAVHKKTVMLLSR
jgi:hypothetical protein